MNALDRFLDAGAHQLLAIYLNDHRAVAVAGRAMAARCAAANRGEPLGTYLHETFLPELDEDHDALAEIAAHHGVTVNPAKLGVARLTEIAGRLKSNGRLRGYSPLSRVIEIESLIAGVSAKIALWSALLAVPATDQTHDVDDLLERAQAQRRSLEHHHHDAVLVAFAS